MLRKFSYTVVFFLLISELLVSPVFAQIPSLTGQATASDVQEEQDYAFGYGLYKDKLYQLAYDQFQKFLSNYPNSLKRPDAMFLSGECRFSAGDYADAIPIYKTFTLEFPRHKLYSDALFRIGDSYFRQKKYTEAIPFYDKVLEKFPEKETAGEAAYWEGEAYLKTGD
ncbi:MAG: tetratricopeptide repeat protein, partial [Bacteroidota bacterium]|nr:tetratricopeptide repeat protein [Bacteroidota bacterium]